jgi:hypothetical protein
MNLPADTRLSHRVASLLPVCRLVIKVRREESMDAALEPGRGVGRNTAAGEGAERELERFISSRHDKRVKSEGERQLEEVWGESERREEARRREAMRVAWASYHAGQAARHRAVLQALIEHHEEQAEKYLPRGAA